MTTSRTETASIPVTGSSAASAGNAASPARRESAAGLLVYALTLLVLVASGAAPSPLYPVYQEEWTLPPVVLTLVFAVYVAGLLATLLTAGRLSDHIGRRPVILGALVVSVAAMLVFAFAHDGLALVVARILQGLAIGLATGALGAGMIDHQPSRRSGLAAFLNGVVPPVALTVGALGSGFLVAYGPAPEETVFVVLAALMVAAGVAVAFVPERQPRRAGALRSLVPSVAVPRAARSVFTAVVGGMIASWALGGMFLAFIGSVLGTTFGLHSAALTGTAIALFTGTGAITGIVIRTRDARRSLIVGVVALVLGPIGLVAAIWTASLPLFAIAAVIGGVGFGAGFQAGLRLVLAEAPVDQRASFLSSVYVASYLAFGVPSIVAGVFVEADGLPIVLTVYGAFVAASALVALVLQLTGRRTRRAERIADALDAASAS
ncbi:MFS transporter [Clavibacter michiganensis subsp. michiganensis]|uniref:MFS transporter n=1 Tax=Clavibacter michiganensis TaxID=28447 RepID=UPI000B39C4E4|nr:MFS transporter [Clavibacter michiganensis]MWJ04939.1 MFS transporter [Clavibacter michiganensis subsp. michiganensis]MWJ11002.1 MFS transporter [Clavibacter michiganensis subsp. michiganensis]MWJ22605.1 MFS transporter [Clavibacter michiganensis subsp. michiganensis]MWJ45785.1 MFS transporter [Clavibacter michiganensis subsp. michiganensis]OUD96516.1 multidrug efflux system protein MdtL [Clavibacter michiganensis subsp. michiganensis]